MHFSETTERSSSSTSLEFPPPPLPPKGRKVNKREKLGNGQENPGPR